MKVAVVTGAASGIGRALAHRLDREGWQCALVDVNASGLEETARAMKTAPMTRVLDVSKRELVEAFAKDVLAKYQAVDLVVNNAGVTVMDSIADVSYDDFEWLMGINFWGVVYGTKAFLPSMLARNSGVVVNVSSIFGIIAWTHQGPYNAAKFAVRGFTEALWQELAGTGVRAMTVHPGGIKTNIVANGRFRRTEQGPAHTHASMRDEFQQIARTTPERAAEIILKAAFAGKKKVLVGADAKLLELVQRLFPVAYHRIFTALAPKVRPASHTESAPVVHEQPAPPRSNAA